MTTKPLLGMVEHGCRKFILLAVGGSVFCFLRGTLRDSSRGCRLAGGVQDVVTNGPRVRRWAARNGAEKVVVLGIKSVLHEGPLNTMVAWGAANALLSAHRGTRVAVREGLWGAAYGGILEIVIYGIDRLVDLVESSG